MAIENPLNDPDGKLEFSLFCLDMITTIFFAIEMVLKVVAFGLLINGEHSYLRNISNFLDFSVVILSVIIIIIININIFIR